MESIILWQQGANAARFASPQCFNLIKRVSLWIRPLALSPQRNLTGPQSWPRAGPTGAAPLPGASWDGRPGSCGRGEGTEVASQLRRAALEDVRAPGGAAPSPQPEPAALRVTGHLFLGVSLCFSPFSRIVSPSLPIALGGLDALQPQPEARTLVTICSGGFWGPPGLGCRVRRQPRKCEAPVAAWEALRCWVAWGVVTSRPSQISCIRNAPGPRRAATSPSWRSAAAGDRSRSSEAWAPLSPPRRLQSPGLRPSMVSQGPSGAVASEVLT